MALCLAIGLGRPLLLEGLAEVGKTEVGPASAKALKIRLIRLQCYEGLDANATIYECNYERQLLAIRAREREALTPDAIAAHFLSRLIAAATTARNRLTAGIGGATLAGEVGGTGRRTRAALMLNNLPLRPRSQAGSATWHPAPFAPPITSATLPNKLKPILLALRSCFELLDKTKQALRGHRQLEYFGPERG